MLHNLTVWRGGAERLLFTLSQSLRRLGYQVDIYVLRDSPEYCFPELREGLRIIQTQRFTASQLFSATPSIRALEMANKIKNGYDIIHAHNFPAHIAAMLATSKPTARHPPFIWQCNEPHRLLYDKLERGFYVKHALQGSLLSCVTELAALRMMGFPTKTLDKLAANRAFAVTALSNYEARILHELFTINPIVIPPGVDATFSSRNADREKVREKYDVGDALLILTVSRLWPSKNLESALKAFRAVLNHLPDAFYMIVGDGPSKRDLTSLSKQLGIEKQCIFVPDCEVGDGISLFYSACDIFLFTALGEPWGLTALEAMMMEKPVVASADGGLMHFIQDHENGILVNPRNPDEIARALIKVMDNSSLAKRLGRVASETASLYSWDRMAMAYDRIYQEALASRH